MPAKEESDKKLFDVRTVKNYIGKGQVDRKEYERFLKSLPDVTDKAEPVDTGRQEGAGSGQRMRSDE